MAEMYRSLSAVEQMDLQKRIIHLQDIVEFLKRDNEYLKKRNVQLRGIAESVKVLVNTLRENQSYETFWLLDEMSEIEERVEEYEKQYNPSN